MVAELWPFRPKEFASIFPDDLPYFIQTGATHSLGRAVSLIDSGCGTRIDAQNRFDKYSDFCRCLRGNCQANESLGNNDRTCKAFDLLIARRLIARQDQSSSSGLCVSTYRCYMGLLEMATVIRVGDTSVMLVSGQFMPPEGPADVLAALSSLGKQRPSASEVSPAMARAMEELEMPASLWTDATIPQEIIWHLGSHLNNLESLPSDFEQRFLDEAHRIRDIATDYYGMRIAKSEGSIAQAISHAFIESSAHTTTDWWEQMCLPLEAMRTGLSLAFVGFFAGGTDSDTILTLRASVGKLPMGAYERGNYHFNWRKAGLRTEDSRDIREQTLDHAQVGFREQVTMSRGFRGGCNPFGPASTLIPARLPEGPFGLLVLGPSTHTNDLSTHEKFIKSLSRDLATRILTRQLAETFKAQQLDWSKTSRMTGHRVRASVHAIKSNLSVLQDVASHRPGFSLLDGEEARVNLDSACRDLTEVSYAAEADVPCSIDVRVVRREHVLIGTTIEQAVANQQAIADSQKVRIDVDDGVFGLRGVFANPTLLRYVFINLINNGLKYSFPPRPGGERVLRIHPPRHRGMGEVSVEIVNFGLGIREADRSRVFEWGVRLAPADPFFKETYGQGLGLWECRHVIEGHGGNLRVSSSHYTGTDVTDSNIRECITVFTVTLPAI